MAKMYSINFSNAEVNRGNYHRIKECFRKAELGESITVGFLGGSITQGARSSVPETCYAYLVYKWFVEKFPKCEVTYLNAGIGGTTSQYGVARVKKHLLQYKPDFILNEFAVNDDNNSFFRETYEGLVRVILSDENKPGLLLMNNVRYDDCTSAEDMHLQVAKHYSVPMVSMKSTILPEVKSGKIPNREITPDDLHPNDAGHKLVADVIISYLEKIYLAEDETNVVLESPLSLNAYEDSIMYQADNSDPVTNGFIKDIRKQEGILDIYKNGWIAEHTGDSISFEIYGTGVAVQYRKSVNQPAPIAEVIVDGDLSSKKMLNANFDQDWGDCLYIDTIVSHVESKRHTVEIKITEAHEDDAVPFYLVSVIGSKGEKGADSFEGGSNLFIEIK